MVKTAYRNIGKKVSTRTPANVKADSKQIKNEAGGYGFEASNWQRLDRFLFLGTEGGTFYVKESKLTKQNTKNVLNCIKEDGLRTVNRIVELSVSGRTFKQSPLLFALALASVEGDKATRKAAYNALNQVARIPTHLFEFVQYRTQFGGWGRGLRRAVAEWYRKNEKLDYHAVKYQSRDGWSNADLIRLSHPAPSLETKTIIPWILGKDVDFRELPKIIQGFELAKQAERASKIVNLIEEYDLPREAIPTNFLNDKEVWEALLEKMPLTAVIRNLGKMTQIGLLQTGGDATRTIVNRLSDADYLKRSRIHPMVVFLAHMTYSSGHGFKGSLQWTPIRQIIDATDDAFYRTFDNVESTGKKLLIAIDGSGSMHAPVAGTNITCKAASAAMALITLNAEPDSIVCEFGSSIKESAISPKQRITDVINSLADMGGTNCALPMVYLEEKGIKRDAIVMYTDHETWLGYGGSNWSRFTGHPFEALRIYRRKYNTDAKLVTLAMAATKTVIGENDDKNFLEVVGLDSDSPNIVTSFIKGVF